MIAVAAAVACAWLLGTLLAAALWPREDNTAADRALIVAAGGVLGLGVTSVLFFAATITGLPPGRSTAALELALIAFLAWRVRRRPWMRPPAPHASAPAWLRLLVGGVLAAAAAAALVVAIRAYQKEPYGGWDAWAIWNMHARFMTRAAAGWPEIAAAPQLSWTHPDYPRMVPASVARVWTWRGTEGSAGAAAVSAAFALALFGLVVAAAWRFRGPIAAALAALLLLSTPFFVTFALNEHADLPLAGCLLAAAVLLVRADRTPGARGLWVLAGVAAGFSAWTKNEGLLFASVFGAGVLLHSVRTGTLVRFGWVALGLGAGLAPVAWFKALAPANDLVAAPLAPRFAQVLDLERHRLLIASWARDLTGFGEWGVAPFLVMALPFAAWPARRRLQGAERLVPGFLLCMAGGYHLVYLLSPHDLAWHVNTSLVRLLLQLWPLALLVWCLAVPLPEVTSAAGAGRPRPSLLRRALRTGLALAVAVIVAVMLSRQLAANELAARRGRDASIRAIAGPGWYPPEQHAGDRWAWSGGTARLRLASEKAPRGATVSLRFELRSSSAPRTVFIRLGGRTLWEGRVAAAAVPVELRDVPLAGRVTEIEFASPEAGVTEAAQHGGRTLAFALSNLRLR